VPGVDPGIEGIRFFIKEFMHKAFPDLKVEILQMIAEGDLVNTYKVFHATHLGDFMGIAPTGRRIKLYVMDIVRIQNGQYKEHWGIRDTHMLLQQISGK
jgi:predicted ester cyclase